MAVVSLVNSTSACAKVAAAIGADLISEPSRDPDAPPMLILATSARDVQTVARAAEQVPIAGVIAWDMPDSVIGRLLDLTLPVFIGMPTVEQIQHLVDGGGDGLDRRSERARSARYAALESLLSRAAVTDTAATT